MFCSHFNLRIFFSISQAVHCLELMGVPLSIYKLGRSLTLAKWAMLRHTVVNAYSLSATLVFVVAKHLTLITTNTSTFACINPIFTTDGEIGVLKVKSNVFVGL